MDTMPFTVNDFSDLLHLINTHPEWRQKLRQALFPEIDVPQAFQDLAAIIKRLDERLEVGFAEAATDRQGIRQDMKAGFAEAKVEREGGFAEAAADREVIRQDMKAGFAEAATDRQAIRQEMKTGFAEAAADREVIRQDMKTGFAEAAADRRTIKQDVGVLKGESHEQFYQRKADAIFGRYLKRGREATEWVADQLQVGLETGQISESAYDQVLSADLLWGGQVRETGAEIVLVLEASWLVEPHDIERAANRAAILRQLKLKALAVVAGKEWAEGVAELAREQKAVLVTNGKVDSASWQAALADLDQHSNSQ